MTLKSIQKYQLLAEVGFCFKEQELHKCIVHMLKRWRNVVCKFKQKERLLCE